MQRPGKVAKEAAAPDQRERKGMHVASVQMAKILLQGRFFRKIAVVQRLGKLAREAATMSQRDAHPAPVTWTLLPKISCTKALV
mmetsp:Transcript_54063/g.94962  ORF Transcript_54063/g.94962 Transcript_54063/m.94962 type:complete len:84 (+) Transcript_54063:213-464(+)